MTTNSRFTFCRTAHMVVSVADRGTPIGLLSRTRNGYELRSLDGTPLREVYGVSRGVAAGLLAQEESK